MLPIQRPAQGINHFIKLAGVSAVMINSFLPPSSLALTSGVSKSFRLLAASTFSSPDYTKTVCQYLNGSVIGSALLLGALRIQNPPTRDFFSMMAGHKKYLENLCRTLTYSAGLASSKEIIINVASVALSLKEWTLKTRGSEVEQALVKHGNVNIFTGEIIQNILANIQCSMLNHLQQTGGMTQADALMFNKRGRKNIENPGVLVAFNAGRVNATEVCELDDAAIYRLNSEFFLPFLQVMKRSDPQT